MSKDIQDFLESAKEFANTKIRPFAAEFEEKQQFPTQLIKEMGKAKLLGATFPKKYNGLDLDPYNYGLLTEIIGKADCTARSLLTVHTSLVGSAILRWGKEAQKNKWLPDMAEGKIITAFALTEPNVGTDASSIQTRYEEKENAVILNGSKKWITFSGVADYLLVIATNGKKVNAYMVDTKTPGVTIKPIKGLMAAKASYISEIEFTNVEVPKENRIGVDGGGFAYIVSTALDHGRYSIAWGGLAIAQEALDAMVNYSRERKQFGKKIYTFQLIQEMIANAVANIHSTRAFLEKVASLRQQNHQDSVNETIIAKYLTSKIAMQIATDAVQVHGGNGFYNKYPVERLFREAKVLEVIEGTSQVLQNIISLYGLKKYYKINS